MREPAAAAGGEGEVFFDGHAGRAAPHGILVEAADKLGALVLGFEGDVFPVEEDRAAVGEEIAADRVEERRLAGAI